MKKLERFFWEWGWIVKGALVLLWVIWAIQLYVPMRKIFTEEIFYQKQRDPEAETKARVEGWNFIQERVSVAKLEGSHYGPIDYFADLTLIYKTQSDKAPFSMTGISELQSVLTENIRKGYFKYEDIEKARESFSEKFPLTGPKTKDFSLTWRSVFSWFITLYCRSVFLVFLLYLIRMCERNGILQTILAEKRKFVLAVLGWMFYIHKYPFNVLREIRVEAELRRLGKTFRRFGFRERLAVRRIANSSEYHSWLAQFQSIHQKRLRVSLAFTVFATILIRCIPQVAHAAPFLVYSGTDPPAHAMVIADGRAENPHVSITTGFPDDDGGKAPSVIPAAAFGDIPMAVHRFIGSTRIQATQTVIRKIDRIPLFWLFRVSPLETMAFTE